MLLVLPSAALMEDKEDEGWCSGGSMMILQLAERFGCRCLCKKNAVLPQSVSQYVHLHWWPRPQGEEGLRWHPQWR